MVSYLKEKRENKLEVAIFLGANCSFGAETIEALTKNYKKIILLENSILYDRLLASADNLSKKYPDIVFVLKKIDVTDISQITTVIFDIEKQGDKIKAFIYAAGVNILSPALDVTEEVWDKVIDVNLKGFFFAAKNIISHMIVNKVGGSIVAVASQHAVTANIDRAPYCASKAGLIHLVKELSLEFAEYGIRINAVSPGFILSPKNTDILLSPKNKKEYLLKIPQKKYVTPENVAEAISFFLYDSTKGIIGHNLLIDGGWTIQ